jgi:protein-S-isoprenylcysteine O-methyltransferase Ste14
MKSLELKMPPLILLVLAILLMVGLRDFYPLALLEHGLISVVGVVSIGLGLGLMLVAAMQMRRHRATLDPRYPEKTQVLLDKGLFAVSRNPIYLGMVVILFGTALLLAELTAFLVLLMFVRYLTRYQIEPEEACLEERFASDFEAYCNQVRRWI